MAATPSFDDGARYVRELTEFLSIPSISADPARKPELRQAAEWVAQQLSFAHGRVVETDGHPVVLGEWLEAPGAPTILVYGHYDVQPPGNEAEWETPPFSPAVRDGRIYARGATDDKGPMLVPLQVAEAFLDEVRALSVADREALARVPFDEEGYRVEVGVPALHGEPGFTALERLWTRPTLEVNGVEGGGSFTVIPRRARAHVTCRLVPDQNPAA